MTPCDDPGLVAAVAIGGMKLLAAFIVVFFLGLFAGALVSR